jgi:aspartate aminotransferase-like enzyme
MTPELFLPGPCPLPPRVRRAVAGEMINPRGPEFAELLADCTRGVKEWTQTDHDVLFTAASGMGALEGVVANLLSPGEQALFCTTGLFGELWARVADAFGVDVMRLDSAWGEATEPEALADALDRHPAVRTVFLTHCETSTGVCNDVAALAAIVKQRGLLLALDSISAAPGHPLAIDDLGADVVMLASQKGWLAPPGLAMVAVSPDALRAAEHASCPRYYFDFARQKAAQARGLTHTTPPLAAMYGLREGLAILRAEGRDALWARHRAVGAAVRAGLQALDLTLVATGGLPSETVTAVRSPFASPAELSAFIANLERRHGIVLAEGVGELTGRAFRIGHLGTTSEADAARLLERLRGALLDAGHLPAPSARRTRLTPMYPRGRLAPSLGDVTAH